MLTYYRNKGNHEHNLATVERGVGEILLTRRPPGEDVALERYKPCPDCFAWVSNLAKHRSYSERCVMKKGKMGKKSAEIKSGILLSNTDNSQMLVTEVTARMREDRISEEVKADDLIRQIGEACLKKNLSSKLMRGTYASTKMRLCARVLLEMKNANPSITNWTEALKPKHFYDIVDAAKTVSGTTEDDCQHPSNALKTGYHIKELCDTKETKSLIDGNEHTAQEAILLQKLIEKNWAKEISSLACATANQARFNKSQNLPVPDDLAKLSGHLTSEAKKITSINNSEEYKRAVHVTQARLLLYNKRRPGEVQGLT